MELVEELGWTQELVEGVHAQAAKVGSDGQIDEEANSQQLCLRNAASKKKKRKGSKSKNSSSSSSSSSSSIRQVLASSAKRVMAPASADVLLAATK